MTRMTPPRSLMAAAVSGLALIMVAGPAAANEGEGDTHSGKVGRHAFIDHEANGPIPDRPGARCSYTPTETATSADPIGTFDGVSVRAPKAASLRGIGIHRQRVAWRFVLQERLGEEGEWTKVKRSRLQVRRWPHRNRAEFDRMKVRYEGNVEAEYRVKAKLYWLRRGQPRRVIGKTTHIVRVYRVDGAIVTNSCPGAIEAPEAP